jgi:hypothetical protein
MHEWGPGLITVSWSLCNCGPAVEFSGGGAPGHLAVYCAAAPGCRAAGPARSEAYSAPGFSQTRDLPTRLLTSPLSSSPARARRTAPVCGRDGTSHIRWAISAPPSGITCPPTTLSSSTARCSFPGPRLML